MSFSLQQINSSALNETRLVACNHVDVAIGNALQYTNVALAVLILAGLSFTVHRNKLLKDLLWGVPGIVVPVNLLSYGPRRYISMLVFGMMSGDILRFFFNHESFTIFPNVSGYMQIFLQAVVSPLLLVCYISIRFFPLLACVGVAIPILGPALGLVYASILFTYNTYFDILNFYCKVPRDYTEILGIFFAMHLPIYLASLVILLWFLFKLLDSLITVSRKGYQRAKSLNEMEISGESYYFRCVRHLLKRPAAGSFVASKDTIKYKVVSKLFPFWMTPRRLPLKFISAMIVTFFMIYQFGLLFSGTFLKLLVFSILLVKEYRDDIIQLISQLHFEHEFAKTSYEVILSTLQGLAVILPAAPVVAMVFSFLLLFHLYITVHKNIVETSQGKYKYMKLRPTLKLSNSWRYPGYQIAFGFTAFLIYTFWLCVLGFAGMIVYFAFKYFNKEALFVLASILIPVLWVLLVMMVQMLLAKIVFIQDGRGKFMALTNQRLFHWVTYFLFIYDAIYGLLSAMLRAVITQVVSLLLMIRLDTVVLMRGFEFLDIGHKAYIGFLHLNHTYNNPVVHTFVRLLSSSHNPVSPAPELAMRLLENCDFKCYGDDAGSANSSRKKVQFGPTRVRNRWLVAYTLIRNPSLQPLTAKHLQTPPAIFPNVELQSYSDPV